MADSGAYDQAALAPGSSAGAEGANRCWAQASTDGLQKLHHHPESIQRLHYICTGVKKLYVAYSVEQNAPIFVLLRRSMTKRRRSWKIWQRCYRRTKVNHNNCLESSWLSVKKERSKCRQHRLHTIAFTWGIIKSTDIWFKPGNLIQLSSYFSKRFLSWLIIDVFVWLCLHSYKYH